VSALVRHASGHRRAQHEGTPMHAAAWPSDPALPQLAQALDPLAMARVFGAELRRVAVEGCEIESAKYRPGRNCSVLYRLLLRDERPGARHGVFEQRVAARVCSGGESAARYGKALARSTVPSRAGPALSHWPALDMLAHWLPNDAKLDALALLYDDSALRRRSLDEVVATLTSGRGRLIEHRTQIVQVVPELRICARVELQVRAEPGAPATHHALYAKADIERSGAATQAVMLALRGSVAQAGGRLRTPQPVLWQPSTGLHWQCAEPGVALQDAEPRIGAGTSAQVGAQLAAFHATPVPIARSTGVELLRSQARHAAELLGGVEPAWRPLLARLEGRLAQGAAALAWEPAATLHGDLHPRNILVDGARLAFIDLDSVHTGPAVLELGGWVADTLYRATLEGVPLQRVAPSWRAFLAAHAHTSGHAADEALLAWSAAHHLLCKRAYRGVANLKPGRLEAVPALLALANAIAAAGSVDAAEACELEPA
jgi:Phosphotransferase enzyme family